MERFLSLVFTCMTYSIDSPRLLQMFSQYSEQLVKLIEADPAYLIDVCLCQTSWPKLSNQFHIKQSNLHPFFHWNWVHVLSCVCWCMLNRGNEPHQCCVYILTHRLISSTWHCANISPHCRRGVSAVRSLRKHTSHNMHLRQITETLRR